MKSAPTFCIFLLLAWQFVTASLAQDPLSAANAKKVGTLLMPNGTVLGSCFYVDDRGYVATSFSNIVDANEALVLFNSGEKCKVTGVVAASSGKDIAILEIKPAGKGTALPMGALELAPELNIELNEELLTWAGPKAAPAPTTLLLPKLTRRLVGEEYIAGLTVLPKKDIGTAPDVLWLWLSYSRHRSVAGGPVFNLEGKTVAMMSAALNTGQQIFSAIHISQIADLIPKKNVKPKVLKTLRNWIDEDIKAETDGGAGAALATAWSTSGFAGRPGQSRLKQLTELRSRIHRIEEEQAGFDLRRDEHETSVIKLLAEDENIKTQLNAIVPEEAYTTQEKVTKYRTVEKEEKGPDGKDRTVRRQEKYTELESVTRYRHSARQLSQMKPLRERQLVIRKTVQSHNDDMAFSAAINEPFVNRLADYTRERVFYCADPLGLTPKDDQAAFENSLSEAIDSGEAPGIVYIARAIARLNLGKLPEAKSDATAAADADRSLSSLANAIFARCKLLKGDPQGAIEMRTLLKEDSDARLQVIAARMDLDANNLSAAMRRLQEAAKIEPLEFEIQHGLAWVIPSASSGNPKLAVDAARGAVRLSYGRDWSARAALASAYAFAKKSDQAKVEMEAALSLAPTSARPLCEAWSKELQAHQTISRKLGTQ